MIGGVLSSELLRLSLDEIVLCPPAFVEGAGVVGRGRVNVRVIPVIVLLFVGVEVVPARPRRTTTGSTVGRVPLFVITLVAFVLAIVASALQEPHQNTYSEDEEDTPKEESL